MESASEGDIVHMFEADLEEVRQNLERVKLRAGDSMLLPPSTVFSVYVSSVSFDCICRWFFGAVICVCVCVVIVLTDTVHETACALGLSPPSSSSSSSVRPPSNVRNFECACVRVMCARACAVCVCVPWSVSVLLLSGAFAS